MFLKIGGRSYANVTRARFFQWRVYWHIYGEWFNKHSQACASLLFLHRIRFCFACIIYCARTMQRVHAKKKIRTKDRFVKENEKAVYISHTMKLHVHLSKFWTQCHVLHVCYNIPKLNKEDSETCILERSITKAGFLMFQNNWILW